jgi:general secretion pathway protein I
VKPLRLHTAGFTLIEVIVAIAIVAIGMAALFSVLGNAAGNASGLRERTFAAWIAQNRIVEVRLSPTFPSVDRSTGEVEFAGSQWVWEQVVSQTAVQGMRRIDVSVRPKDAAGALTEDRGYTVTVSGFVGRTLQGTAPSGTPWGGVAQEAAPPGTPIPPAGGT